MLPSDRHMGFNSAESIGRVLLMLLQRFWRVCSAALLIIILIFHLYGGKPILIILIAIILGALYHYQDSLLYFPEQPESARIFVQSPVTVGLAYENVHLVTKDGYKIAAYFIKQSPEKLSQAPTLLYFHGNAGNIGHRLHNAQALFTLCGFNILLVEYRGYGKSEGTPSESGLYLDSQAAMEYLLNRRDIDSNKIIVFGRSLGGAVAVDLASHPVYSDKIQALIIENTFTSIPGMALQMFPGVRYVPLLFFKNKFVSRRKIKSIRIPTLLLSGTMDRLVPPKMMMDLYQASGSTTKHIDHFDGGTHNDTWTRYGYYSCINKFITPLLVKTSSSQLGNGKSPSDSSPTSQYFV
jgi:fermentation-respiration switch protein FrsA (DUF1100 family)